MLTREAPAKVNLGLRITGVRDDGYHLLESLFVPLDLVDRVGVRVVEARAARTQIDLSVTGHGADQLPAGDDNLVARAARALLAEMGLDAHVEIALEKGIPSAAGLGGGSSDAAAVLRSLAELLPDAPDGPALERIALGLGADVPFFLDPKPALVTGIGEGLEPVDDLPALFLLLANPGISLATAEVYAAFDALSGALTPPGPGSTMRTISGLRNHPSALRRHLDGLLQNDLEPAAVRLCPPVARLRARLLDVGAEGVGMSGSGATLFGVFRSRGDADVALRRLEPAPEQWAQVAAVRVA